MYIEFLGKDVNFLNLIGENDIAKRRNTIYDKLNVLYGKYEQALELEKQNDEATEKQDCSGAVSKEVTLEKSLKVKRQIFKTNISTGNIGRFIYSDVSISNIILLYRRH